MEQFMINQFWKISIVTIIVILKDIIKTSLNLTLKI